MLCRRIALTWMMISIEDLARILDLLIAIATVHIKQYDEDKDAPQLR